MPDPLAGMNATSPLRVMLLLISGSLVWRPAVADEPVDPLLAHRGHLVVVEFPELEDVGKTRAMPKGWRYLAVTAESYDRFEGLIEPDHLLALLYFDEFGNLVLRDHSRERIARIERSTQEAVRRISTWRRRFSRDGEQSVRARTQGDAAGELSLLVAMRETKIRGYPEIEAALARLEFLEGDRLGQLWSVLAQEGVVRRRELREALDELLGRSRGLRLEPRIRREVDRVASGGVTDDKTGTGGG